MNEDISPSLYLFAKGNEFVPEVIDADLEAPILVEK
jgi:hypothetical protein